MNEENISNTPPSVELKNNVIEPENNPLTINNIRIEDIIDKETFKRGADALIGLISQIPESEKGKLEIRKQELSNEIILKQLETEDFKNENDLIEKEYTHFRTLDSRNKLYTISILVLIIIACIALKHFDVLDKSESRTIIIFAIATGLNSNSEFIKKLFTKKAD